MITENYEAKIKNNAIRMEIIDLIMDIFDTKSLQCIKSFANSLYKQEFRNHPMTITTIAFMTDTKDINRIMKVLKKSDPGQLAVDQMKEAFGAVLESCSECDKEKKNNRKKEREVHHHEPLN
ncbi:MAG: hypothetical protein ACI4DX_05985 [Oliverpabstia sp.]